MDVSLGASLYADAKWHGLLDDPFRAPRSMKSGPGVVKNFLTFSQIWALKYTNHLMVRFGIVPGPRKIAQALPVHAVLPVPREGDVEFNPVAVVLLCGEQKSRGQFQNLQEHHILMQYFQMRVLSEACI